MTEYKTKMPQCLARSDLLPVSLTGIRADVYQLAWRPLPSREESQGASTSKTALGKKQIHYDGMGQAPGEANELHRLSSTP